MSDRPPREALIRAYEEKTAGSKRTWEKLRSGLVDGVASSSELVDPYPLVIDRADGSKMWDIDGNEYIDLFNCWGGVSVLGHNPEAVTAAVAEQMRDGSVYGQPFPKQHDFVTALKQRYPAIDLLRFTNSGTEATKDAVRVARSYTGRDKIVKLEGCYHGSMPSLLVSSSPSAEQLDEQGTSTAVPDDPGVPESVLSETLVAPFNDAEALASVLEGHDGEIAAVILEAVPGFGTILEPEAGYLREVRRLTDSYDVVLIVDEVKTGCRIAAGGACDRYGIDPDLVTLGKAITGGLPGGAFGGDERIMREISFRGDGRENIHHIGTYNGNPALISAGTACLNELDRGVYDRLETFSMEIAESLRDCCKDCGITASVNAVPALGYVFFGLERKPSEYRSTLERNTGLSEEFWLAGIDEGLLYPPKHAAWYLNAAHTREDIRRVIEANKSILETIA